MSDPRPSGPTDPDAGIYNGKRVARRFVSPEGFIVLVGKTAEENDTLSIKLGAPHDFWFHLSGDSGSHVVVRNPDHLPRLPRDTLRFAAALAAGYSKGRNAKTATVHMAQCVDISKPRGFEPGKVLLRRYESVHVAPLRAEDL